jgi:hypothetical protein
MSVALLTERLAIEERRTAEEAACTNKDSEHAMALSKVSDNCSDLVSPLVLLKILAVACFSFCQLCPAPR